MTDPADQPPALTALRKELRELAVLKSVSSVLGWDEQVNLRPAGSAHRAEQLAMMAGLGHARATDPKLGELIAAAEELNVPPDDSAAAVVRDARRDYDRATKLPRSLVEELSRSALLAQQAWVAARRNDDFAAFRPHLDRNIDLKREEANAVGSPSGLRYDALLDDYERGMTAEQVDAVFAPLADSVSGLVRSLDSLADPTQNAAATELLERTYPIEPQRQLSRFAAEAIGFDLTAGRIDEAAHPFCSGFGPGDCRLTTRYDVNLLSQGLYGTLHEAGHGLYEQGLPAAHYGTGLGESCSLGIHESQSRLWENFVGRSLPFWTFLAPTVKSLFPGVADEASPEDFAAAASTIRRSFIRVESDEVTYNLHIVLRYELERQMIDGDLKAGDVPEAWNSRFRDLIGIDVPRDSLGCLQDVHWAAGLIGYFPTYALGNLYAAQLMESIREAMPRLDDDISAGRFGDLLDWLRTHIHAHGARFAPPELVERATGRPPTAEPLNAYLAAKVDRIAAMAS